MPLIFSLLHLRVELRGLCQVPPFCSCCLPGPFDRAPPSIPNLTFFQFISTLAASLIAHWVWRHAWIVCVIGWCSGSALEVKSHTTKHTRREREETGYLPLQ